MANDNSERKKWLAIVLTLIIISIIAYVLKINLWEVLLYNPTAESVEESTTNNYQGDISGELLVYMIDVGQADSFLLVQGDEVALIDCGTRSTGKNVVEYLKNMDISKIDYLFGTHPHDDHMGGMYDVITNFEIGTIILPEVGEGEVTSNWYMKLMNEIKNNNYTVEYAKVGTIYNLGDASMKIIGPFKKPEHNLNNYSTVLKVSFGEMDIIMTGDAEKDVEQEIIESGENIDAEILKVGHHGSDTSSSQKFLDEVKPQYALISTKVGNKYVHPIKTVMDSLKERKITVYRTDECGTVILTITYNDVKFNTEPGDYLSGTELKEREEK